MLWVDDSRKPILCTTHFAKPFQLHSKFGKLCIHNLRFVVSGVIHWMTRENTYTWPEFTDMHSVIIYIAWKDDAEPLEDWLVRMVGRSRMVDYWLGRSKKYLNIDWSEVHIDWILIDREYKLYISDWTKNGYNFTSKIPLKHSKWHASDEKDNIVRGFNHCIF